MEQDSSLPTEQKKKADLKLIALWVLVVSLCLANIHAIRQASQAHARLDQVQRSLEARLVTASEEAAAFRARAERAADDLRQQLQQTGQAVATTAERRAAHLVGKLDAEYRQQQSAIASELGEVKQAANSTSQKVASVADDVNTVRGDVAQNRTDLAKTRTELKAELETELKSVRGDLGIQSGLIATNARELAGLRQLGERHYYEFNVAKTGRPFRIANISVVLRKTDPKRNKFNLDVLADDKKVEKKDKYVNEPVQFYVSRSRQPYELVVNEVKKDRVTGYLSVPKVLEAAAR